MEEEEEAAKEQTEGRYQAEVDMFSLSTHIENLSFVFTLTNPWQC